MTEHKPPAPQDSGHLSARQKRRRATVPVQVRRRPVSPDVTAGPVCWRCGRPFASTTVADLKHCAEIARSAA